MNTINASRSRPSPQPSMPSPKSKFVRLFSFVALAEYALAQGPDPCSSLVGLQWVAPQDVRACFQTFKDSDGSVKRDVRVHHDETQLVLMLRFLRFSTLWKRRLPTIRLPAIKSAPRHRMIKTYTKISWPIWRVSESSRMPQNTTFISM